MGCCKSVTKVSQTEQSKINETADIDLKTKKDFQRSWEEKNHLVQTDITSIWSLTIAVRDISKVYQFEKKEIGSGHYGVVRRAKLRIDPNKIYAVKSIEKKKLKGDITLLKNELEMLRFSDHPNIIQFYEIYQDSVYFHFVMEHCEGGDITTRLENQGAFNEDTARRIVFQVLYAINHLHSCGIVHRDIKPDNFLFKNKTAESEVKLIDFGLSRKFSAGTKLNTLLGTPYYVAPEILDKRGYTEKVDLWSVGVMLYLLLVADFPFKADNNAELFEKIRKSEPSMTASPQLRALSANGKALLKNLMEKNPNKRFSARQALRDPWFDQLNIMMNERGRQVFNVSLLNRLRTFKSESKFGKEVIRLLVMIHDDSPDVLRLHDAFFYLDVLDNGVINESELKKAFTDLGEEIESAEVEEIVHSLELRTKGVITYTDFVTACIDQQFFANDKYLTEVFKRFDIDQDEYIGYEDVQDCFSRFGIDLKKDDVLKMIAEFDKNGDFKISYPEFLKIMTSDMHKNVFVSSPTKISNFNFRNSLSGHEKQGSQIFNK